MTRSMLAGGLGIVLLAACGLGACASPEERGIDPRTAKPREAGGEGIPQEPAVGEGWDTMQPPAHEDLGLAWPKDRSLPF